MEEEPHIVKEFMIGNTNVKIADNYCRDKTPEDVEKILARIARIAQNEFNAMAYRAEMEKKKKAKENESKGEAKTKKVS